MRRIVMTLAFVAAGSIGGVGHAHDTHVAPREPPATEEGQQGAKRAPPAAPRPRWGFMGAGFTLFAVGYGVPFTMAVAYRFEHDSEWLAIPIVGPFVTLARMESEGACDSGERIGCGWDARYATMGFVLSGLFQAGGVALIAAGAASPQKDRTLAVTPIGVPGGAGLGAVARF